MAENRTRSRPRSGTGATASTAPTLLGFIRSLLPFGTPQLPAIASTRPRLIFGFDATASREPAWATARTVTDALVQALPGELDVALAVHGGSMLHTFTGFTADAKQIAGPRGWHLAASPEPRAAADTVARAVERRACGSWSISATCSKNRRRAAASWPMRWALQGHQADRPARHAGLERQARRGGVPRPGAPHRRLRAAVRCQRAGAAARAAGGDRGVRGGWRGAAQREASRNCRGAAAASASARSPLTGCRTRVQAATCATRLRS